MRCLKVLRGARWFLRRRFKLGCFCGFGTPVWAPVAAQRGAARYVVLHWDLPPSVPSRRKSLHLYAFIFRFLARSPVLDGIDQQESFGGSGREQ